ncbi:hypothetical protein [Dyadobacter crusticola]|uniref:hypothetical protein n=1 Tax=Dyadobacter crusticola TaxID=292407 RepID=UPI000AE9207C|nr:hypothetical protein [Dyadobacter crusticola]
MLKGQLSDETFSYRDSHRFTDSNYILVVKDEEFPNNSLISIFYNNNGKLLDIDEYEMGDRILATKNMLMDIPPLNERFSLHQLAKISSGTIIKNEKYHEGSTFPKSITFHTNVYALRENEIVEIFEGIVSEESAIFELNEIALNNLLKDYIQTNNSFFVLDNNILSGPFKVKNTDTSGNFIVEKGGWIPFGDYEYSDRIYVQFEANHITRRIIVPSVSKLSLIRERDFVTNSELLKKFENRLSRTPELYSVQEIDKILDITKKVMSDSLSENREEEMRLREILGRAEQGLLANIDLANVIPEIPIVKHEIERLELFKHNLVKDIQKFESIKLMTEQDINASIQTLDKVRDEIKDIEKFKAEELKKQKISLEDEIVQLEEKRKNIDEEIEKERESKSISIKELEGTIKYLEKTEESLKLGISTLQENFTGEQKTAHKKLQELLVINQHYNILSGKDFDTNREESHSTFRSFEVVEDVSNEIDKFELYKNLKDSLVTILSKHNRKFDSHFIDNILISIHQCTLTLFAGMPGSGKTSLARILMSALAPKERTREVSVAKGWTSQKDLIGFFNPLSKKFHSSSTNVYSLLRQLDWERQKNAYMKYSRFTGQPAVTIKFN